VVLSRQQPLQSLQGWQRSHATELAPKHRLLLLLLLLLLTVPCSCRRCRHCGGHCRGGRTGGIVAVTLPSLPVRLALALS
jgi:hypothetical protein